MKCKLIRIATVPNSFGLLKGQLQLASKHHFEAIGIASPGPRLQKVEDQEQVRTIGVEMTRTISPVKDLKALWKLYKIFKKEKPTIVHSHTPKAGTLGMLAARIAGVPYRLHTIAGLPLLEATGAKRSLLNAVERITYASATHLYPNSYGLQKIILDNKFTTSSKLKVIGNGSSNGIDTSVFNPAKVTDQTKYQLREELGIDPKDFVFLYVGRVVSDKGINELVQAFLGLEALHTEEGGQAHLVLVGKYEKDLDPLLPETDQIIRENRFIHSVGVKYNVVDYYAMANALAFPSYREGFPNVVMEAAAMQLNSIVTDINGCNEIISNGINGWIVPVKNTPKLQDRMQWCLRNSKDSVQMGLKSREIIQEKYERSYVQNKLIEEYNKLLDPSLGLNS